MLMNQPSKGNLMNSYKCIVTFILLISAAFVLNCSTALAAVLADGRVPKAAIVISQKSGRLECKAASELARYIKDMTGASVPVLHSEDRASRACKNVILIGRPETNAEIANLVAKKLVRLSTAFPGGDGFIIKTATAGSKNYLVIGGSNDRGTLYAVCDFLERICRVGFFWDGDRIPSLKTLSVSNIDVVEKPFFEQRCNMPSSYAMVYWDTKDWKREVDWEVRKRFSMSWGLVRPGMLEAAVNEVLSDYGVKQDTKQQRVELGRAHAVVVNDADEFLKYQKRMTREVMDYARDWGVEPVYDAFLGDVPKAFVDKYPKVKHFEYAWGEYVTDYIHPADPLFTQLGAALIRKQNELYGPSHFYYISPYPEVSPGSTKQEKDELQLSFAKGVVKGMTEADPKGTWLCSGWAFTVDRATWNNDSFKRFLDAIPNDKFLVWDTWSEMHSLYKPTDYFFGKNWAFGALHCFGGNCGIFGDVKDLIRRTQDIATDPKAKNCKQFFLCPEGVPYNSMYFDLATKLAWDPRKVDLKSYLPDFATRRYGQGSVGNMVKCWQELVESVHSTNRYNDAFYLRPLGTFPDNPYAVFQRSNFVPDFTERLPYIGHIKKALEYALLEKDRQTGNKLYQHDVVDITKQYLGELFNYHLLQMYRAFAAGNRDSFEHEAKKIGLIMDDLAKIVSTREDYLLQTYLEKALCTPGVGPDTAKKVRDRVTGFDAYQGTWGLWDYNAKDYFELMKFYHRKRVDFYISVLREKLQSGATQVDCEKELTPTYRQITRDFINNGPQLDPATRYQGSSAEAATEIFAKWKDISSLNLAPLFGREVKFGPQVIWQNDFTLKHAEDGKIEFAKPISIYRQPVMGFRSQLVGGCNRMTGVYVVWDDSSGRTRETQLYPTVEMWSTGEWEEYRIDLYRLLSLLAELERVKPVSVRGVRISPSSRMKWDWMNITGSN